jgi:hemerythrin-like domain-containing protein
LLPRTTERSHSSAASNLAAAAMASTESKSEDAAPLPPLSPQDFRAYNEVAERMDMFHNHFRSMWNMLWNAAVANRRPAGMSLKTFIREGISFAESLTMHHNIEEAYFFPKLGARMPEFAAKSGHHVKQHKQIHAGLDKFHDYLKECLAGQQEFEMSTLKAKMETWGEVLWAHLDEEVKTLGAENMRKYWTKEEVAYFRRL